MQIPNSPVQPSVPGGSVSAPPIAAAVPQTSAPQTEAPSVEDDGQKGILDYAKMPFVAATEFAAKGQARNMVEIVDDFQEVGENLSDLKEHLQEYSFGGVGRGVIDGLKALGNTVGMVVDVMQAGMFATVGGLTMIPTAIMNGADGAAESLGNIGDQEDAGGIKKALGSIGRAFGGKDTHVGYTQMVQDAGREEAIKTRSKLQD